MAYAKQPIGRHRKHRIFLVEDHPVMREGFARLINFENDFIVCGQAGTARAARAGVEALNPDLVVMDISLAGTSGIELIKDLVSCHPLLSILVLSVHDELLYAERALRAGAKGYVMKHAAIEQIMTAIRQVLHGKIYLSEDMNNRLLKKVTLDHSTTPGSDLDQLSDRELEVFQSIGEGRSTREIATALRVSSSTVATHRAHIMRKLNLESSRDVMRRAVEWVQSPRS